MEPNQNFDNYVEANENMEETDKKKPTLAQIMMLQYYIKLGFVFESFDLYDMKIYSSIINDIQLKYPNLPTFKQVTYYYKLVEETGCEYEHKINNIQSYNEAIKYLNKIKFAIPQELIDEVNFYRSLNIDTIYPLYTIADYNGAIVEMEYKYQQDLKKQNKNEKNI